jgi:hypothetical protein
MLALDCLQRGYNETGKTSDWIEEMKQPISWHRECASNARRTLEREELYLASAMGRIARLREQTDFYDRQIAEAERRGMSEFDSERLLVKRQAIGLHK